MNPAEATRENGPYQGRKAGVGEKTERTARIREKSETNEGIVRFVGRVSAKSQEGESVPKTHSTPYTSVLFAVAHPRGSQQFFFVPERWALAVF